MSAEKKELKIESSEISEEELKDVNGGINAGARKQIASGITQLGFAVPVFKVFSGHELSDDQKDTKLKKGPGNI